MGKSRRGRKQEGEWSALSFDGGWRVPSWALRGIGLLLPISVSESILSVPVGFAWNPADGWVVRGGAALVYIGAYDLATPIRFGIGFSTRVNLVSPDGGRTSGY